MREAESKALAGCVALGSATLGYDQVAHALHDGLGVNASNVDGMVLMQGMLNRQQIDGRFFKCRLCRLGLNVSRQVAQWLTLSNSGRLFTLPACEEKRCRTATNDPSRKLYRR